MKAVGKKNRTSLHSLYDFVLMTRGILCIGTGGHNYKRTRGLLCFGISSNLKETIIDLWVECQLILKVLETRVVLSFPEY